MVVIGDYVSSSPIDSHAHVKKKGTRERYRLKEAADLSLDTTNISLALGFRRDYIHMDIYNSVH